MGESMEIKEGVEQASKVKKELEMMLDAARDGLWIEVNQAEVGLSTIEEANDALNDADRDTMRDQIMEITKLLANAKGELGDGDGKLEDLEGGSKKGLKQEMLPSLITKVQEIYVGLSKT